MNKKLVIIGGPTAVGKTDVSISLAKHYGTEIISCDSRQMYRELSIGTAVPSPEQLNSVKHHFIQNISIHDYYNAYLFEIQSLELLQHLFEKQDIVVMTGGSGLYIDAVINGIDDLPTIDLETRNFFKERLFREGLESLRMELKRIDPDYYTKVDLKNPKRILKALEVSSITGKPYSSFLKQKKYNRDFQIILIGLQIDRQNLYDRIAKRTDIMFQNGLLKEAGQYYSFQHLNSLNTVGYKELFKYFEGVLSLDEAIELIKRNTRHYARRQMTWLRRYHELKWFDPQQIKEMFSFIEN